MNEYGEEDVPDDGSDLKKPVLTSFTPLNRSMMHTLVFFSQPKINIQLTTFIAPI